MRLIDADELLARIRLNYNNHQNIAAHAMKDIIDTTTTAYDVEKVVEELENLPNREADYYYALSNDVVDRERVIEIVKRGGVE